MITIGYFDIIFSLTGGGPNNATEVLPLYMYNSAFKFYQHPDLLGIYYFV